MTWNKLAHSAYLIPLFYALTATLYKWADDGKCSSKGGGSAAYAKAADSTARPRQQATKLVWGLRRAAGCGVFLNHLD